MVHVGDGSELDEIVFGIALEWLLHPGGECCEEGRARVFVYMVHALSVSNHRLNTLARSFPEFPYVIAYYGHRFWHVEWMHAWLPTYMALHWPHTVAPFGATRTAIRRSRRAFFDLRIAHAQAGTPDCPSFLEAIGVVGAPSATAPDVQQPAQIGRLPPAIMRWVELLRWEIAAVQGASTVVACDRRGCPRRAYIGPAGSHEDFSDGHTRQRCLDSDYWKFVFDRSDDCGTGHGWSGNYCSEACRGLVVDELARCRECTDAELEPIATPRRRTTTATTSPRYASKQATASCHALHQAALGRNETVARRMRARGAVLGDGVHYKGNLDAYRQAFIDALNIDTAGLLVGVVYSRVPERHRRRLPLPSRDDFRSDFAALQLPAVVAQTYNPAEAKALVVRTFEPLWIRQLRRAVA